MRPYHAKGIRQMPTGPAHHNWKGGRIRGNHDRIMVIAPIGHPRRTKNGYVYEYILVAERMIGRYVAADEVVHHTNGNHHDNRPENLQVMTRSEHTVLHLTQNRQALTSAKCPLRDFREIHTEPI